MPVKHHKKQYADNITGQGENSLKYYTGYEENRLATSLRELTSNSFRSNFMYCFLIPRDVFVTDRTNNRRSTEHMPEKHI